MAKTEAAAAHAATEMSEPSLDSASDRVSNSQGHADTPGLSPLLHTATSAESPAAKRPSPRLTGLLGTRLAHYLLEEELGRGGMGIVFRGTDLALERPVAIKVLAGEVAESPKMRDMFYREARSQARINHSNVCHIYYVGEQDGRLFFAMELIEGESVADLVADGNKLSTHRALDIVRQATLGLREADRHGIIHRDVKPSNLMIDRHGVVKVLDFGIATLNPTEENDLDLNAPVEQTTVAGTPLYAAPEQLAGAAVDFRADVYALGATLHQLLTGKTPFSAETVAELTLLHSTESRPRFEPAELGKRDLGLFDYLTDKMMAKRPEERHESYDELLDDLEFTEPVATRSAGFFVRGLAVLVDMILMIGVSVPLILLNVMPDSLGNWIFFVLWMSYTVFALARFGTTLGKRTLGIEVISGSPGRGIGFHRALLRTLVEFGPLMVFELAQDVTRQVHGSGVLSTVFGGLVIAAAFLALGNIVWATIRHDAVRTAWDRLAKTQVRYLRVNRAKEPVRDRATVASDG